MQDKIPYTIAIIPARGGSKGLPRKNLATLGGLPLVAWSVRAASHCPGIHRVVVSTDDEEIACVAIKNGAEVPFLRPASLAGDKISLGATLQYTLQQLDGPIPEVVISLLPTHPFRTKALMQHLTAIAQSGYGQVHTVVPILVNATSHMIMDGGGRLTSIFSDRFPSHTVDHISLYRHYGLFYAFAPACPKNHTYNYEITDPVTMVDIDTPDDLHLARLVVDDGLFSPELLQ